MSDNIDFANLTLDLALEERLDKKWNRLNQAVLALGGTSLTLGTSRAGAEHPDFFVSSYENKSFWKDYLEQDWHECDPSAVNAVKNIRKTIWETEPQKRFRRSTKFDDFSGSLSSSGLMSMLCFTNESSNGRIVSGFTVTINAPLSDLTEDQLAGFETLSKVHSAMSLNIVDLSGSHSLTKLSEREIDVLRLLSKGQVITQIAFQLGISYRMVTRHLTSAKEKLGALTNENAVSIAVELGLV
ncbi:LuxR C-terminal-related transcriptional regulator [Cognatishimia sp. D5M38]|uniref:LuxR C-terminal-related transcriptional regulator n=1 Tax=Cognatishimia coralii TaxID=3083254 RepID=A0ABU8QKN4_9RHOB